MPLCSGMVGGAVRRKRADSRNCGEVYGGRKRYFGMKMQNEGLFEVREGTMLSVQIIWLGEPLKWKGGDTVEVCSYLLGVEGQA